MDEETILMVLKVRGLTEAEILKRASHQRPRSHQSKRTRPSVSGETPTECLTSRCHSKASRRWQTCGYLAPERGKNVASHPMTHTHTHCNEPKEIQCTVKAGAQKASLVKKQDYEDQPVKERCMVSINRYHRKSRCRGNSTRECRGPRWRQDAQITRRGIDAQRACTAKCTSVQL